MPDPDDGSSYPFDWFFPIVTDGYWYISQLFGVKHDDGTIHAGLDIAATQGTAIIAPTGFKVLASGWNDSGYGNWVKGITSDGKILIFGHMVEPSPLSVDQWVEPGDPIGLVGTTGNSTGPHLHFEVRDGGSPVDPADFLNDSINVTSDMIDALVNAGYTPTSTNPNRSSGSNPPGGKNVSITGFLGWVKGLDYKRIFGNVTVVFVGGVLIIIGLVKLGNSEPVKDITNKVVLSGRAAAGDPTAIVGAVAPKSKEPEPEEEEEEEEEKEPEPEPEEVIEGEYQEAE